MHNSQRQSIEQLKNTNIFINPKVRIYVFEVPSDYTMIIDRQFLISKIIIPLQTREFGGLREFLAVEENTRVTGSFEMMYHYNCSNQYYEKTGYTYLLFFYVFLSLLSLRSYFCISTNRPRFQAGEGLLIVVIILKTVNQYVSMISLQECPWLDLDKKYKMALAQVYSRALAYNFQMAMFVTILSAVYVARNRISRWQVYQGILLGLSQLVTDFIHEQFFIKEGRYSNTSL